MYDTLVLFCGGPPIYGGVPKPLQRLRNGETLLEHYLHHSKSFLPDKVFLLVDDSYEKNYLLLLQQIKCKSIVDLHVCENNSSTLGKMKSFLSCNYSLISSVMFSYPDIFITGGLILPSPSDSRITDGVFISYVPVSSRFPRLVIDPYSESVRGISNHTSQMPPNPLYVFGGHLFAKAVILNSLLDIFLEKHDFANHNLEFDLFYWLVNINRAFSMRIYGGWVQGDSQRDLDYISNLK